MSKLIKEKIAKSPKGQVSMLKLLEKMYSCMVLQFDKNKSTSFVPKQGGIIKEYKIIKTDGANLTLLIGVPATKKVITVQSNTLLIPGESMDMHFLKIDEEEAKKLISAGKLLKL